ncbi:hypothetical protein LMTR3_22175 [Bradyrhizobium sp. LMTR 3]|nr:hypothetical protein LMTR3_22175 [Bradyrhizobium sp. LMTR 3]
MIISRRTPPSGDFTAAPSNATPITWAVSLSSNADILKLVNTRDAADAARSMKLAMATVQSLIEIIRET